MYWEFGVFIVERHLAGVTDFDGFAALVSNSNRLEFLIADLSDNSEITVNHIFGQNIVARAGHGDLIASECEQMFTTNNITFDREWWHKVQWIEFVWTVGKV